MRVSPKLLQVLQDPISKTALKESPGTLVAEDGRTYRLSENGIPLFAEEALSAEGKRQQEHYDRVSAAYLENLKYPHTQVYMEYLDACFLKQIRLRKMGTLVELCCGQGESLPLLAGMADEYIGVDVSLRMLEAGRVQYPSDRISFVQGDATLLPLRDECADAVVMLGGIHHVPDRMRLFKQVHRVLRPGGHFYWREPVSDFILWRILRGVIYRFSPSLDAETERPLVYDETVPLLEQRGFEVKQWATYGFVGFCLFMNSDILIFNRSFRHLPGIRRVTKMFTRIDDWALRMPGLSRAGLQVVGLAVKPEEKMQ